MTTDEEGRFTVLLLEDSPDDEALVLRALRKTGIPLEIKVARDGEEGVAALGLAEEGPKLDVVVPDLVISDLKMPRINGDEILRRARADARYQNVPYVIFSSSADDTDVARCERVGASAYYRKPVVYDEFIRCASGIVRHWLSNDDSDPPTCEIERTR